MIVGLLSILVVVGSASANSKACQSPGFGSGECTFKSGCPWHRRLMSLPDTPERQFFESKFRCSGHLSGNPSFVCCVTPAPVFPPELSSTAPDTTTPCGSANTLPTTQECGKPGGLWSKIVGGKPSKPHTWPWFSGIIYSVQDRTVQGCGGSLINSQFVLTAAHCGSFLTPSDVILGQHYRNLTGDETVVKVDKFIMHPKYIKGKHDYDIALIKLQSPVVYTDKIRPICLPTPTTFGPNGAADLTSRASVVIGVGAEFHGDRDGLDELHEVYLEVVSYQDCAAPYSNVNGITFDESKICAGGEGGKDSCQGDSGGPLATSSLDENSLLKFYQIGVVSTGKKCATAGVPGIYSDTIHYRQWIEEVVRTEGVKETC